MGRADSGCIDIGFGFPITFIISPINPGIVRGHAAAQRQCMISSYAIIILHKDIFVIINKPVSEINLAILARCFFMLMQMLMQMLSDNNNRAGGYSVIEQPPTENLLSLTHLKFIQSISSIFR